MYLHVGIDTIIETEEIIAVLDMDSCTITGRGREFLKKAEKSGKVINVSMDTLPKTYIVTEKNGQTTIYVSPISSTTIAKRIHQGEIIIEGDF